MSNALPQALLVKLGAGYFAPTARAAQALAKTMMPAAKVAAPWNPSMWNAASGALSSLARGASNSVRGIPGAVGGALNRFSNNYITSGSNLAGVGGALGGGALGMAAGGHAWNNQDSFLQNAGRAAAYTGLGAAAGGGIGYGAGRMGRWLGSRVGGGRTPTGAAPTSSAGQLPGSSTFGTNIPDAPGVTNMSTADFGAGAGGAGASTQTAAGATSAGGPGGWWQSLLNTNVGHNRTVGDYPLLVGLGGTYLAGQGLNAVGNVFGQRPQRPQYNYNMTPQPYGY